MSDYNPECAPSPPANKAPSSATTSPKILICAGETSGDKLGANLIAQIQRQCKNWQITIMGGAKMQAADNVKVLLDARELAIVGIWESLMAWRKVRPALATIKQYIQQQRPQLVILIDYPGFNLHIAHYAKQAGAKVLFYVSPQIWAWRYGRIHKIKQRVDHMAVLFPFEAQIYRQENIPVSYVGHPLSSQVKADRDPSSTLQRYQLTNEQPIICILPGSRRQELKLHLPLVARCLHLLRRNYPHAQFILPLAAGLEHDLIRHQLGPEVIIAKDDLYNCLAISDVALCASGTASLEVALMRVPMVIFYKLGWITYILIRMLAHTQWIGLCNIMLQKTIVREFIQHQAEADGICKEVLRILHDKPYRESMRQDLAAVGQQLSNSANQQQTMQVMQLAKQLLQPC